MDFRDPVDESELNFCARLKFTEAVKQKNPKLGAMEAGLEKARRDDGYIGLRLSRTIERPRRKGSRDCRPGEDPSTARSRASRERSERSPPTPRPSTPPPSLPPSAGALREADEDAEADIEDAESEPDAVPIPPPRDIPARTRFDDVPPMEEERDDEPGRDDVDEYTGEGPRDDLRDEYMRDEQMRDDEMREDEMREDEMDDDGRDDGFDRDEEDVEPIE